MQCPKCFREAEKVKYLGSIVVVCKKCNYDERKELDQYATEKTSQKAKSRYNVYKSRVR